MLKSIESTGKSEQAAIESALKLLALSREDVKVEVLAQAKSGFFGIGARPAKVRVFYQEDAPEQAESTPEPMDAAKTSQSPPPRAEEAAARKPTVPLDPGAETLARERAEAFLSGLFAQLNVAADIEFSPLTDGIMRVSLHGKDLSFLIGRRGETLDALQHLTNCSVNRNIEDDRVRIFLDAQNYRAKREESLRELAQKVAEKVALHQKDVALEPMNAYERHIIHEVLQNNPNVTTYSTGSEPNRRTVVVYRCAKK